MKVGGQVMVIVWAAAVMLMCTADGRRIDVGGKVGWTQAVNYTLWASQQTFYVGDWLCTYISSTIHLVYLIDLSVYLGMHSRSCLY